MALMVYVTHKQFVKIRKLEKSELFKSNKHIPHKKRYEKD